MPLRNSSVPQNDADPSIERSTKKTVTEPQEQNTFEAAGLARTRSKSKRFQRQKENKDTFDPSTSSFSDIAAKFNSIFTDSITLSYLDTGSIGLNYIFGGGLPRGRMSCIHSPAGLGKTASALHASKSICRSGGRVLFIDVENALNDTTIHGFGLDEWYKNTFLPFQLDTFSDAEDLIDDFLACQTPPDAIFLDSITMLVPSKLLSGDLKTEDVEPGLHARLTSTFLNKYKHKISKTKTHFMLINQQRTKLNFHNPAMTKISAAGGAATEFIPDIVIEMSPVKGGQIKKGDDVIGYDIAAQATKNKVTAPFVPTIISVIFGQGISNTRACTYLLQAEKLVIQNGSIFKIVIPGHEQNCSGRIGLETWIKEHEDLVIQILKDKGRL